MRRASFVVCSTIVLVLVTAAATFAADDEPRRPARPVWGTVVKVSDDSITVQPESPKPRRRRQNQKPAAPAPPPAERTFALSKDQTEFAFAEVGARMPMADGSTLRTLHDPEPATAADVKPGQLVEVTSGKEAADAAAAARIIIAWSVRGTIVKVNDDSITFRPDSAADDRDDASAKDGNADAAADAADADDQTLTLGKDIAIRIKALTDQRPSEGGRGFVQSFTYKPATRADLKAGQSVDVCIKNGTAAKITINQVEPAKGETP